MIRYPVRGCTTWSECRFEEYGFASGPTPDRRGRRFGNVGASGRADSAERTKSPLRERHNICTCDTRTLFAAGVLYLILRRTSATF